MKLRLRTILLLLLAGAMVNVGVAWGLALLVPPLPTNTALLPWKLTMSSHTTGLDDTWSYELTRDLERLELVRRAGAPMRSLQLVWHDSAVPPDQIQLGTNPFQWLPLVPTFGFAVNTLFYAALVWLLFLAPFTLRHHFRMRRGRCPACAYPVGESAVCSECGERLREP